MNSVITLDNVSKAFPIYANPKDMLAELVWGNQRHDNFWALKNISFNVTEKSRVGIIGPNGSGKSTLLQLVTGNLKPTTGTVHVDGKISGMLSLNSVLNPNETGLNNIRFNLILNGAPRKSIDRLTEEIIEFTELGQFIYSPVRTYSSGMNARLAFAIATSIEPEILIVDEVLSVGDAYFVGKATKRMTELCDKGKALLFVSHSTADVRRLCDTAIWMENGTVRMMGPSEYVITQYEEDFRRQEDHAIRASNKKRQDELGKRSADIEEFGRRAQFRIVAESGEAFVGTYYVKSLNWSGNDGLLKELDIAQLAQPSSGSEYAMLDLYNSEWGRLYDYRDVECRVLEAKTGRNQGGHLFLPLPLENRETQNINLQIEYRPRAASCPLAIEFFNSQSLQWQRLENLKTEKTDGWVIQKTMAAYQYTGDEQKVKFKEQLEIKARPDIEILDVDIFVEGESVRLIDEKVPFTIRVAAIANERTENADICLKIMRSDGVYTFWQSSGLESPNISNVLGKFAVEFVFSENLFGSGDYMISVVAANGWSYTDNYPHSQVFDRKVSAVLFKIERELEQIAFGVINQRVKVKLSYDE